jgi:hypothetical protein
MCKGAASGWLDFNNVAAGAAVPELPMNPAARAPVAEFRNVLREILLGILLPSEPEACINPQRE